MLRLPVGLHAALQRAAQAEELSLNELCVRRLSAPIGAISSLAGGAAAVLRAAAVVGAGLVGVLAFGSWSRRQLATDSDVDVLVVVGDDVGLTRELYRRWDTEPISWGTRPVDAHFVHLPPEDLVATGTWCEAAIDGVVLFERRLQVSRRLVQIRWDILEGRIVRRLVHGQPYWAKVA